MPAPSTALPLPGSGRPPITTHLAGGAARAHPIGPPEALAAPPPTAPPPELEPGPPPRFVTRRVLAGAGRGLAAAAVVAALAVAGIAAYRSLHRHGPAAGSATPQASIPVRAVETWVRANLPRPSPLRAELSVADSLVVSGYPAAAPYDGKDAWHAGTIVVTTRAIRADVARRLATRDANYAALPLAVFGAGADRVDVDLVVGDDPSGLEQRLRQDAADRSAAEAALLTNPRVTADAAARRVLTAGALDLRAATVLALLAARADVHLTGITTDPAEAAAHRPARAVTLTLTDPDVLTAILRALPPSYAPADVTASGGARHLTWPAGLAPTGLG